jgi:uracil-DNA glycosylase
LILIEQRFSLNGWPIGWREKIQSEFSESYFVQLTSFLKGQYAAKKRIFPPQDLIFRALQSVDYPDVRVVLLGQDPYHGAGQAIGLSFAVPNELFPKPPSLLNIFKEIQSDLGVEIPKSCSDLSGWAKQGVLLLNAVLTVEESKAGSHQGKGWEVFTDKIIQLLNEREKPVIFLLWGSYARRKKPLITNPRHFILEGPHPSPLSAYRGFFGCRHFSKANDILAHKIHSVPIDWSQTVAPDGHARRSRMSTNP